VFIVSVRTGQAYRKGLQDGREIWVRGERVADVTTHPALARTVESVAALYDLQCATATADDLTFVVPQTGDRAALSFLAPRTRDDLVRRRRGVKLAADKSVGLIGRSPDFLNIAVTAFAAAADFFADSDPRFGRHIQRYYEYCRDNDVFLSHATINPQTDRSRSSGEQAEPFAHLRIVRETDDGVLVRGTKMIGTLAPIADELLVFPLPRYAPGDEPYTVAFGIPLDTEGLRLVCREPFGEGERDLFDHPLSAFDEIDATCVFDDVLVPWDRVFFYGDVEKANRLYDATTARQHTGHHGITRGVAKAELMVGIALALAQSASTDAFLHVQEMLGEIIGLVELAQGAVLRAEEGARLSPWGTMTPAAGPIHAMRYHFPRMTARMAEVIQILGGGSLLSTPCRADLDSAIREIALAPFRGAHGLDAEQRIQLLKLAWDACGDAFGQRQLLYERYHSGDPVRLAATQYATYDKAPFQRAVATALRSDRSATGEAG
jgi:4-hydroxyphenylacetate 3-monooxygenase oxygenase component